MKLTAMSTLCVDVIGDAKEIRPGGEALNFAVHAEKYSNISVSIIGAIGDDQYGNAIMQSIQDIKIDKTCIHIINGGTTANNRIYLTEDGDRYFRADSWTNGVLTEYRLGEDDINLIKISDVVFLNYYCPYFSDILEMKTKYGFKLAVDFDEERDFIEMEKVAAYIDFFMISGNEEILHIFKNWSEKYAGLFNITLAEKGSVTYCNGREYRVAAVPVAEVTDTTGCGDSYHAGFVCSYLDKGDIVASMEEGSRVASGTLQHYGGFPIQ